MRKTFLWLKKWQIRPICLFKSEGEEEGYESYSSKFLPPDLAAGFVHFDEDRCHARYRKCRAQPNDPYLVCLNGSNFKINGEKKIKIKAKKIRIPSFSEKRKYLTSLEKTRSSNN